MHIAIIGATGLVGRELLALLESAPLPITSLQLFASKDHTMQFQNADIPVFPLPSTPPDCDLAFFCAGSALSLVEVPKWIERGATVIDLSSAFRKTAPLIIPEINPHALKPPLIASPNCTTTIMLMALYPLHQISPIKRIVASTYQAASGGGRKLLDAVLTDTKAHPKKETPYAFNLFLHPTEEPKLLEETERILETPIPICATCIRVPTLRVHALSLNVTFAAPVPLPETKPLTPRDLTGKPEIVITKAAHDPTCPNTLSLFVLGDQLLKGAALNALQIALHLQGIHAHP